MSAIAEIPTEGRLYRFFLEHDWGQHEYECNGKFCLSGAIRELIQEPSYIYSPLYHAVNEAAKMEMGCGVISLNDYPGMTKERILAFLLKYTL